LLPPSLWGRVAGRGVWHLTCRAARPPPPPPPHKGEGRGTRHAPCAIALPVERERAFPAACSCSLPVRGYFRWRRHVPYLDARRNGAAASVFERALGRNSGLRRAVVERRHQRRVAFRHEAAPHLLGAGEFAVVGIELLGQHEEAPNL